MKTRNFYLVAAGLWFGLLAPGCQERNPAYVGKAPPKDASSSLDTHPDVLPGAAETNDTPLPLDRRDARDREDGEPDGPATSPDLPAIDESGGDLPLPRDVRDTRRSGDDTADAPPDLAADNARDAADVAPPLDTADAPVPILDGGIELGAFDTAPVDAPPLCPERQTRPCQTPGNPLLGACRAGTQTCVNGAWAACSGEVLPTASEICGNGIDDNCNGMTDEGCTADCVVVAPDGNDATGDGTPAQPFATLAAGLAAAVSVDGGAPQRVCVAGGATCADTKSYAMDTALAVPNGARVQGNYALAAATLSYCAGTQPPTTTLQFTAAGAWVRFGDGVTLPTELGGFAIERFSPTSGSPTNSATTAVAVSAGKNVTLSEIFVTDSPTGDSTYGVQVENGGQVTIVGSAIVGGNGRIAAVGVYVNGGSVALRDNCDQSAHGVCASSCADGAGGLGIRGRNGASAIGTAAADSSAVYVTGGSPAGSTIVGNLLCGGSGNSADGSLGANVATMRCESGACATITGNAIAGGSGRLTLGLALTSGPALVDSNAIAAGCGTEGAYGALLVGSSAHVRNNRILGSTCTGDTAAGTFVGLRAVLTAASGEPDVHSNDIDPRGGTGDCQSTGVTLERSAGQPAPAGIFRNNIIAAGNCRTRTAINESANASARLIEHNDLFAAPPAAGVGATTVLVHRAGADATTIGQVNALDGAAANISANPKFVSYPDDLHLSADSPCVDQGTKEGAPADDADGTSRPQGSGYDIGAYELAGP